MSEGRYRSFVPLEKLPADWPNAVAAFLAPVSNLNLAPKNATTVMAPISSQPQLSLGVDGLWRYVEAEVDAAVPSGASQTFDIVATTTANVFHAPTHEGEGEGDETNYAFALTVVTHNTLPSGGGIAAAQKVGEVDWDGAKIIGFRQLVGDLRATDPITPTQPLVSVPAVSVQGLATPTAPLVKIVAQASGDTIIESFAGSTAEWKVAADGNMEWPVAGVTLTVAGGVADLNGQAIVLNNDGRLSNSRTPTGAAGGDLSSNYPNPQVSTVLGGQTPVSTTTAIGGDLTGTLPNPTIPALGPIGSVALYAGFADPNARWLLANGRALSRATYATLMGLTTIARTGTTVALSKTVKAITTENLTVGYKVEGAGIPANTTITAIGVGEITLSKEATASASNVALTFFPWGNGNESTTFNMPNIPAGVAAVGAGVAGTFGMGQRGGAETVVLTTNQLATHAHGVTDPGHVHTPTDPGHVHGVSDPGHSHSVNAWTNNNPAGGESIGNAWTVGVGFTNPSFAGVNTGIANGSLTGVSIQSHTTGITIQSHTTGLTVNNVGTSEAHPNMPPWVGLNAIVRVL